MGSKLGNSTGSEVMTKKTQATETQKKRGAIAFLALALAVAVAAAPSGRNPHALMKVVIDAGHGGKDPGNKGTGRYSTSEKDVTLAVARKLGDLMAKAYPDMEIVFTRTDDSFPTLKDRVTIANDAKADLFISIHCDAFTKPKAKGSSTFVMGMHKNEESLRVAMQENASIYLEENYEQDYAGFDPKDPDTYIALSLRQNIYLDHSLSLSNYIQREFRDQIGRTDRGVRQAGYYVISYTTMPSVLVELGFLTNPDEEDFLVSEKGQLKMTEGLFRAFAQYKADIEGIAVEPVPEAEPEPEEKPSVSAADLIEESVERGIVFKVQVLSSTQPLADGDPLLKGLESVEEVKVRGMYKYLVGATADYQNARKNQATLRELGFADAFVVAFNGNKRLDLAEAIRKTQ